jgi:hypothetical protein
MKNKEVGITNTNHDNHATLPHLLLLQTISIPINISDFLLQLYYNKTGRNYWKVYDSFFLPRATKSKQQIVWKEI